MRILINGAMGKMGRTTADMAAEREIEVVAGIDLFAAGAAASFPLFEKLEGELPKADALIDFSRPEALGDVLAFCQSHHVAPVLCTTGYTDQDRQMIREAAEHMPIFQSANMSLGINVLLNLARAAAATLKGFDAEVIEAHHNTKVDAPSGTALMLAEGVNRELMGERHFVYGRHTKTERRDAGEIGIHAIRGGTVTGEHSVLFLGQDEVVTLKHSAASRRIYALGALRAAEYVVGRPNGLYNMQDMLFEKHSVTSLLIDKEQAMLTVRDLQGGVAGSARIFASLAAEDILVDMISQTAPRDGKSEMSFTVPIDKVKLAAELCGGQEFFGEVTKLTIEGPGMERQSGVAARALNHLQVRNVAVLMITTSETKISIVVPADQEGDAIAALREAFSLG